MNYNWNQTAGGMQQMLQQMLYQKQMAALLQQMQQQQNTPQGAPSLLGPMSQQQPGLFRRMGLLGPSSPSADAPNMVNNQMPGMLPPGQNMIDNQMPNMPAPQSPQMPPDLLKRLFGGGMLGSLFGG